MTEKISYEKLDRSLLDNSLNRILGSEPTVEHDWRLVNTGEPLDWERFHFDSGTVGRTFFVLALTDMVKGVTVAGQMLLPRPRLFRSPRPKISYVKEQEYQDDDPLKATKPTLYEPSLNEVLIHLAALDNKEP